MQVMEVLNTLCEYNVKHLRGELATIKTAIMVTTHITPSLHDHYTIMVGTL
jgi:hypothetical protein